MGADTEKDELTFNIDGFDQTCSNMDEDEFNESLKQVMLEDEIRNGWKRYPGEKDSSERYLKGEPQHHHSDSDVDSEAHVYSDYNIYDGIEKERYIEHFSRIDSKRYKEISIGCDRFLYFIELLQFIATYAEQFEFFLDNRNSEPTHTIKMHLKACCPSLYESLLVIKGNTYIKDNLKDLNYIVRNKDAVAHEIANVLKEKHGLDFFYFNNVYMEMLKNAYRYAKMRLPVFISGERGTGKSHIAEFIHKNSENKNGTYMTVNLSKYSEKTEMLRDLFGYITEDQIPRLGVFDTHKKGTVFLDEVDKLDLGLQGTLLHLIEDGKYQLVGDPKETRLKCRLIFASNQNLDDLVRKGQFLPDLKDRLAICEVKLPPLRDMKESIDFLFVNFLRRAINDTRRYLRSDVSEVDKLNSYYREHLKQRKPFQKEWDELTWDGNIRDIQKCIYNGLIHGDWISPITIKKPIINAEVKQRSIYTDKRSYSFINVEKSYLEFMVIQHGDDKRILAEHSGISLSTITRKFAKYNIPNQATLLEKFNKHDVRDVKDIMFDDVLGIMDIYPEALNKTSSDHDEDLPF